MATTAPREETRDSRGRETEPRPERSRPHAPPAVRSGTGPRVMVAGTAILETVRHGAQGQRSGIGGVAGNIAEALAWAGNPVTMVTRIGSGPHGGDASRTLEERGIRVETLWDSRPAGHAVIETRAGEQGGARGSWPMPSGLWRVLDRLDGEYDAVVSDAHMSRTDLRRVLDRPGLMTMANCTSTGSASKVLQARIPGLGMATMNRLEMEAIHRQLTPSRRAAHDHQEAVLRALETRTLLVTHGRDGWGLYGQGGPARSAAVPVPERTDFVGCGDWAAAGALHAHLHGLDPVETINDFISRKLQANTV